jgi:hypothetical protein
LTENNRSVGIYHAIRSEGAEEAEGDGDEGIDVDEVEELEHFDGEL